MQRICEAMKDAARAVWHWFFPEEIDVPDCVIELLEAIYPGVDWSRVSFYEGIPHIFNTGQGGITLPSTKSFGGIRVYIKSGNTNWCGCGDIDIYVHEGAHVLQITEWAGGYGLGFARPFIILYVACFFDNFSYQNSPFEIPARAIENRFENCCRDPAICPDCPPCDCSTTPPTTDTNAINQLINNCTGLVQNSSGLSFWELAAECTPGIEYLLKAGKWVQETFCVPLKKWGGTDWAKKISWELIKKLCSPRKDAQLKDDSPFPDDTDEKPGGKFNWWAALCILGLLGGAIVWIIWGIWWAIRVLICGFGWVIRIILYIIYGLYYAIWLILWSALMIIGAILVLVIELVGLIVGGIMWLIAGIICGIAWLWEKIVEAVAKICEWVTSIEEGCLHWEERVSQQCERWGRRILAICNEWGERTEERCEREEDQGYERCDRREDQGYERCDRYEDHGYSVCDEWEDWGHNVCCDWAPCSWFCDALVWVANWVCVGYVWVSNIVCVAYTWVSNWVCVAYTWVENIVCVAWSYITTLVCKSFAYITTWGCLGFVWVTTRVCTIPARTVRFLTCWAR